MRNYGEQHSRAGTCRGSTPSAHNAHSCHRVMPDFFPVGCSVGKLTSILDFHRSFPLPVMALSAIPAGCGCEESSSGRSGKAAAASRGSQAPAKHARRVHSEAPRKQGTAERNCSFPGGRSQVRHGAAGECTADSGKNATVLQCMPSLPDSSHMCCPVCTCQNYLTPQLRAL